MAAFLAVAPAKLRLAMELPDDRSAPWRPPGPTWTACDGTHLKHRQSKTNKMVRYRVYSDLKVILDAEKARHDAARRLARSCR